MPLERAKPLDPRKPWLLCLTLRELHCRCLVVVIVNLCLALAKNCLLHQFRVHHIYRRQVWGHTVHFVGEQGLAWGAHHTRAIGHPTRLGSHEAAWHRAHLNLVLLLLKGLKVLKLLNLSAVRLGSVSICKEFFELALLVEHIVTEVLRKGSVVLDFINVYPLGLRQSSCFDHSSLMLAEHNLLLVLIAETLFWVFKVVLVVLCHLSHHGYVAGREVALLMGQ